MKSFSLNAFSGDTPSPALGNACSLFILDDAQTAAPVNQGSLKYNDHRNDTQCYSWPLAQDTLQRYSVQCYMNQTPIRCCGHGLLSAAHHWLTNSKTIELVMHDSEIRAYRDDTIIWLQFPRVRAIACERPGWIENIFSGQPVIAAAAAGDENGYLVLQWPDNFDLQTLSPPAASLSSDTQRAIICTCRCKPTDIDDVQFRYFAPQYGVNEDTATGSAMRILVDFWQQSELRALQVSSQKGLLFGRLKNETVEVGGHCFMIEDRN